MHRSTSPVAYALGLAGLIPFVGCGLAALATPEPQNARWLLALIAYGAVILAFLGGVHWGFVIQAAEFDSSSGLAPNRRHETARLIFGVAPSLIGWAALLSAVVLVPEVSLAILIVGFAATVGTEEQLRRRGLVPVGYLRLRWALSAVVVSVLTLVAILRLFGVQIVF